MSKFKIGDVVRYSGGSTALARLHSRHGEGGWHAEQYYGGLTFVCENYPGHLRIASAADQKLYRTEEKKRHKRLSTDLRAEITELRQQLRKLRP